MKELRLFWPTKNPIINQRFGENLTSLYHELGMLGHNGLDLSCKVGENIYAAHDGIITYAGIDSSGGYGVVLQTLEPLVYKESLAFFKTIYWHLVPKIPVKVGQHVRIGDIIAYGDTTGKVTGTHLHFGLKPVARGENDWTWYNVEQTNGYFGAIDPEPYLSTMTAFSFRTSLQNIADIVEKISDIVKSLLRGK